MSVLPSKAHDESDMVPIVGGETCEIGLRLGLELKSALRVREMEFLMLERLGEIDFYRKMNR
jgi:hypothetical protein